MARFRSIWLGLAFVLTMTAGYFVFRTVDGAGLSNAPEVDWRRLGDLDYLTGNATPDLKSLDGKMVKIPGFMVPLEDNVKSVTQFLLVPSPQACIHVPPPPPNQMVLVEMQNSDAKSEYGPIWVYGTLHLHSAKHMYGESSFQMTGVAIEPYR